MIVWLILYTFSLNSHAMKMDEKSSSLNTLNKKEKKIFVLEELRNIFKTKANIIANQLDSFFATDRADDEFGRSTIRLRSLYQLKEGDQPEFLNQYRINLRLPSLEEKFKWEYYFDKKNKSLDRKSSPKNTLNDRWILNSDISIGLPSQLTTRMRLRKNIKSFLFIHRFVEQLSYQLNESHLNQETSIDSDIVINHNTLFRFNNYQKWEISLKNFQTKHGPRMIHRLTSSDALSYGIEVETIIKNQNHFLNQYQFSMNYRKNLYHQWIYFDFIPGVRFPRTDSFRKNFFLNLGAEMLF